MCLSPTRLGRSRSSLRSTIASISAPKVTGQRNSASSGASEPTGWCMNWTRAGVRSSPFASRHSVRKVPSPASCDRRAPSLSAPRELVHHHSDPKSDRAKTE